MNCDENGYCRLCAELKDSSVLINLQSDEEKWQEIVSKLTQLNAKMDFDEDILPKTVCVMCIRLLETAFCFVRDIQKAQEVLHDLFQDIKVEPYGIISDSLTPFKKEENDPYGESPCLDIVIKKEITDTELTDFNNITEDNCGNDDLCSDSNTVSQLITWQDYDWTCALCETRFPLVDELISHSMQYHGRCNAFRCNDCNHRKLCLDKFLIHVKRHRKIFRESCYKCHVLFSSPCHAAEHKKTHLRSKHICGGCNSSFKNATELKQHTKTYYLTTRTRPDPVIQTMTDDLTCLICSKSFSIKYSLQKHLLIHTERKRDHTCEICGKCFLSKQTLAGHLRLHDNSRPFQCEICKFSLKTKSQLRKHVEAHDNSKPFTCDQCGRSFRLKKHLTSHSIIHTDSYPHVCAYCNKGFRFKTILNQHIRQHTGDKPYSCESCQRDFTNWPNYNKHMKRRHGKNMAKKKRTPDGVFPINPATGEVVMLSVTDQTMEWKRQLMSLKKPGRSAKRSIRDDTDSQSTK